MLHKIVECENKSADWKVVSIQMSPESVLKGVSVNRVNKKGEVFPDFDKIAVGAEIDGELWESGSSKWYLFAPRQKPARSPGASSANITKAQDHKAELVKEAQDRKEDAIKRAAAFRDATLIVVEQMRQNNEPMIDQDIKAAWRGWVHFFLGAADEPFV